VTITKSLLKSSRLLHLYLGVFTTPALIFFAFTGFLQTFSFHETTRGSDYKPPKIFVQLSQLHKKQTLVVPVRKPTAPPKLAEKSDPAKADSAKPAKESEEARPVMPSAPASASASASASPPASPSVGPPTRKQDLWPMKIFFAIVSGSLLLSTITGVYMAYTFMRNKTLVTAALLAGITIPVLLLLF
jgi:hypothetical protein